MSKWISVEERMPDHGGTYLVYHSVHGIVFCLFSKGKWHIHGLDDFGDLRWFETSSVTHWMPLLEPPGKEEPNHD